MRTRDILVRACVVSGLTLGGAAMAQDMQGEVQLGEDRVTADMQGGLAAVQFPQGIRAQADADVENARNDIRETIEEFTQAAFTRGGFDDMVERLVDQDRNRIGDLDDNLNQTLDAHIQTFLRNWETKYDSEFDIDDDQFLRGMAVTVGEVEDPQMAMRHWPVAPTGDVREAAPAAAAVDENNRELGQANLEEGRDVAIATVRGKDGKTLHVSLINEAGGWKIDLPNNISAEQLHQRTSKVLQALNEDPSKLPASESEAYDMLSHKLLSSIYDLKDGRTDRDQAQPASGLQQGELNIEVDTQ